MLNVDGEEILMMIYSLPTIQYFACTHCACHNLSTCVNQTCKKRFILLSRMESVLMTLAQMNTFLIECHLYQLNMDHCWTNRQFIARSNIYIIQP